MKIIILIIFLLILTTIVLLILNCFKKDKFSNNKLHAGVIVEPRNHMALEDVIDNIIINLDIPIIIFHGTENIKLIDNIINKYPNIKFKKYNLNVKNLTINDYNKLLLSTNFWYKSKIYGDKVLLFQTDSGICNRELIEQVIEYDYCGAPWVRGNMKYLSGNGGFSLRNCMIMIKIINDIYKKKIKMKNENEDIVFSRYLNKYLPNNICPYKKALIFSRETDNFKHSTFGFHKNYQVCKFAEKIGKKQKIL